MVVSVDCDTARMWVTAFHKRITSRSPRVQSEAAVDSRADLVQTYRPTVAEGRRCGLS